LRVTLAAAGNAAGSVAASARLPYAGVWRMQVASEGSADYEACTSTVHAFVVQDPRIEAAIHWAMHRRGGHAWDHYCLRFANDSYEKGARTTLYRHQTAKQAATALRASLHHSYNAPRGAYVFYDSKPGHGNPGHVGISLGNGTMINAWGGAGVKVMPIRTTLHYIGWAAPPLTSRITDWDAPPAD
jgi:cell wall-associated NlpC family hydrolase